MTRPWRIVLVAAGSIVLFILIVVISGVLVLRSDWFREQVRERVVSAVESATGGRAEIGSIRFDWHTLTADISDFVIHGTEPAGSPPLLRAAQVKIQLKILSIMNRDVDVALLAAEKPQAFLLVSADGRTNIPQPKLPNSSNKTAAQTILDLKIGRFELRGGAVEVHAAGHEPTVTPYDLRGKNLRSLFGFDPAGPLYKGDLSMQPLEVRWNNYAQTPVDVNLSVILERNRVRLLSADLATPGSHVFAKGVLENFAAPVATLEFSSKLSLEETGRILKLASGQSGLMEVNGTARYASATDYAISGKLHSRDLAYRDAALRLERVRADADFSATPDRVSVANARIGAMGGEIVANAELRQMDRFRVEGRLERFDIREIAASTAKVATPWDGLASGPFKAEGRLTGLKRNDVVADAKLTISPAGRSAPVSGLIDAHYDGPRRTVNLGSSFVALPNSRLDFSGVLGQVLTVHLRSSNLDDLLPAIRMASPQAPRTLPISLQQGSVAFDGTVTGPLQDPTISGHIAGQNFLYSGQKIDSLAADISLRGNGASVRTGSLAYGQERASFQGNLGLRNWKPEDHQPVSADLSLANAQVSDLMALAGKADIAITGTLNAKAQISGTLGNPHATGDLAVTKGSIYQEPYDQINAHLNYLNAGSQQAILHVVAGSKRIDGEATFTHAATTFLAGQVKFEAHSNRLALNQIRTLTKYQSGIGGFLQFQSSGEAAIAQTKTGPPQIQLRSLTADATTTGLQASGRSLGDAHLKANTENSPNGPILKAHIDSDFAHAVIVGDGQWRLTGDYPGSGHLQFSKVDLAGLRALLLPENTPTPINFGGTVQGTADITGPALDPAKWQGRLELPSLEVQPIPGSSLNATLQKLSIRNAGPIKVSMANNIVRIENARFTARETNLAITGEVRLADKEPLHVGVDGTLDLSLLQLFMPDVDSSGTVVARARVRGSFAQPVVDGRLEVKNADLNIADLPNGLSNANGTILFDGTRATIENLTAETGGGKLKITGFAAFAGGPLTFRLQASASSVRIRYPNGVSTLSDADLNLTGTADRSVLGGNITILRTAFNPRTDLSSIVSASSAPVQTPSAQTGILAGVQFDVQIQTSPDISFQTSLTQSLALDANLTLRGTISNPVLLGRINITQGELVFFSNKYTINQGSISFFNPVKLEPVLNIDLETKARGVDVIITVSGPLNKLNVSYRSDPPLQFSDIVALLATGRSPSDATLAARQPAAAAQSWQQLGASALVGQAIANPVAGRLQRFFGVSKIKIDPLITGATGNPQARLTIEQQVTPDIIFTYITDVANTNTQVVRVEWDFSRNWSAVALREENGYFGVDFLYKKRFK